MHVQKATRWPGLNQLADSATDTFTQSVSAISAHTHTDTHLN